MKWIILVLMSLVVAGCGSDGGTISHNATAAKISLLARGDSQCENGGIVVNTGVDNNGNGLLDLSEFTNFEKVCNGLTGATGATGAIGLTGSYQGIIPLIVPVPIVPVVPVVPVAVVDPVRVVGPIGPVGPVGVVGPIGPTGAVGAAGTNGTNATMTILRKISCESPIGSSLYVAYNLTEFNNGLVYATANIGGFSTNTSASDFFESGQVGFSTAPLYPRYDYSSVPTTSLVNLGQWEISLDRTTLKLYLVYTDTDPVTGGTADFIIPGKCTTKNY